MVTTTHDEDQGGRPRLILALGGSVLVEPGRRVESREFPLTQEVTTLGTATSADLQLADTDEQQAEIVHDEFDEYVLVQRTAAVPTYVNGEPVERRTLRTGDRLEIGPWTLSYFREEYADHGRPHGGRQGGEGAIQQPQPPRSELSGAKDPEAADLGTVRASAESHDA
jgi:hypothetical protein